jgi:hypothetical protein
MNHGDPLFLGSTWLFHELVQVIRVTRQKNHRASQFQGRRRHHRINGTPVPGQPCRPEKFAGASAELRSHRVHGDPRQHPMDGCVAGTAPQDLRKGDGADEHLGAAFACRLQEGTRLLIAPREFDETFAVQDEGTASAY